MVGQRISQRIFGRGVIGTGLEHGLKLTQRRGDFAALILERSMRVVQFGTIGVLRDGGGNAPGCAGHIAGLIVDANARGQDLGCRLRFIV